MDMDQVCERGISLVLRFKWPTDGGAVSLIHVSLPVCSALGMLGN